MVSSLQNNQVDLGTDVRLYEAFNALAGQFTSSLTFFAPMRWQGGRRRKNRRDGKHDLLDYRHGWHGSTSLYQAKHVFRLSILFVCY
jgi:hypothetical protein